ncbi:hypothetical protein J1605_005266 [Eschrichtius robustus]|uniref:Methyltransferase-like protein 8 n=1 Tax=Eschrichtius robustus TaxID=9764 RepID=A0AB34HCR2_ESCRO|nr:hypothetical protein J1605_005266 [Eschrichtius robustus]
MQTSGALPFVQPPLVQYSAAQSLTISAALNLDFCLLNSQNCHSVSQPGSAWALTLHHSLEHVPDRKPGDHMQWSKEEEEAARKKVEENSAVRVLLEEQVKYESEASKYWDTFYKIHKNKFFKDRNWLLREFPEILPVGQKTEEKVGCGAGNSVFPILNTLQNAPEFFLYCCDFASGAVELVKSHASYRAAQCCAFVYDVCDDGLPYPFPDGILDVILLVFVLSSIHPDR